MKVWHVAHAQRGPGSICGNRNRRQNFGEYPSPWAAAQALGPKLGVGPETLRKWVVQAQVDQGARPGPSSEELGEIKRLRSEVRDLKEANEMAESTGERTGPVTLRSRQSRDPHRALPGRGFLE